MELEPVVKNPPALARLLLEVFSPCESIAGDLTEEYPRHSNVWFWWQTVRSLVQLGLLGLQKAPFRCLLSAMGGYGVMFYIGLVSSNAFGDPTARALPSWLVFICRDVVFGLLASAAGGYVSAAIDKGRGLSGTAVLIVLSCCVFAGSYAVYPFHPPLWRQAGLLGLAIAGMATGGFFHAYQRR